MLERIYTADDIIEQVDALTADDLQQIAKRLFIPEKLCLAVIGPHRSEERFLKQLHF